MSDQMLHGVLNMPLPDDPADLDIVTWMQFRDRAREASARLAEMEVAADQHERDAGISSDGNMWRFWSDKANLHVQKAKEADARADAAEARLREVEAERRELALSRDHHRNRAAEAKHRLRGEHKRIANIATEAAEKGGTLFLFAAQLHNMANRETDTPPEDVEEITD